MNTANSIFNFVTIRNATNEVKSDPKFDIQLNTELANSLVAILSSDQKQPEKIKTFNKSLNDFLKSKNFYKAKNEIIESVAKFSRIKLDKKGETDTLNFLHNVYDNIVIRTITKSNTNEIFKLLIDTLKSVYQKINNESVKINDIPKLKIILPEGLIFSFSTPTADNNPVIDITKEKTEVLNKINELLKQKEQIAKSKSENATQLKIEQQKIIKLQNEIAKTQITNSETISTKAKTTTTSTKSTTPIKEVSTVELNKLITLDTTFNQSETNINLQLTQLNHKAFQFLPETKYAYIGEKYVDITNFKPKPPIIENDAVLVYSNGCYLKFPFQVADLRVVEQKTVGYLPNEIAHINNTQSGEKQEKVTRRLKRIETFDSLITEDEVTKETDTQSTEKFSLEKAASDVQSEENSVNVNASVSGTYGVVTASLDAGFSHSESSTNSNSSSQSYAKEVVQKVVDRVSHKVKSERSVKSIEEFEETVTHKIDNIGEGPKSYIYRWLTKLVRATLKNYGKRLIFQIDVAHPSNYYLTRIINEKPTLNIPPDPRTLDRFTIDEIDETNYLAWAEKYKAKLEMPLAKYNIVSKGFGNKGAFRDVKEIVIPDGYQCYKGKFNGTTWTGNLIISISASAVGVNFWPSDTLFKYINAGNGANDFDFTTYLDNGIKSNLAIGFFGDDFVINFEIICKRTNETFKAWQIKCYQAIIEAYENLKAEAESKMSQFNPNNPGLNPDHKTELIRTELKKGALTKMFRCNPFWIKDNYEVGKEYDPNCCADNLNAEKIRFLETAFDWKNMTYELYPYFYTDKDNWSDLLNLSDDDQHFETFLQSSYATLRIPVYRDSEKEIAAINFILNNSIANHSVIPASMQHILDDLNTNTPFGYINETETDIPFVAIKKEYDRTGHIKIYYLKEDGTEVLCNEVLEYDKEGNQTLFYYNITTSQVVISEIKEGINSDGQKYNYYFNSANEKIITHRTKTEYDIDGTSTPYYSTDLGIFPIPTDLVILEAGVQDGVEVRGYPEDETAPTSDVIIPKQYSPAIIKKD